MIFCRRLVVALGLLAASATAQGTHTVTLRSGTEIPLETASVLSSKTSVKGDLVALKTADDVRIEGQTVVPKGTLATGQVIEARAKGALGMSGKLGLRPLFMTLGNQTIRLAGNTSDKGSVSAGAVVGMAVLTPGFTGRSATIPTGTRLTAYVERTTVLIVP